MSQILVFLHLQMSTASAEMPGALESALESQGLKHDRLKSNIKTNAVWLHGGLHCRQSGRSGVLICVESTR